jgi:hypothetical protein
LFVRRYRIYKKGVKLNRAAKLTLVPSGRHGLLNGSTVEWENICSWYDPGDGVPTLLLLCDTNGVIIIPTALSLIGLVRNWFTRG